MLRRLFGSGKKVRRAARSRSIGLVERCEQRIALTTVSFSGGYATVVGTAADETITLADNGSGSLGVTVNGTPLVFTTQPLAGLIGFAVYGGNGNDTLTLDASLGAKQGFLYGQGGNDALNGGTGLDRLYGGIGLDTYSGGLGQDNFFTDPDDYTAGSVGVIGGTGTATDIIYLSAATTINVTVAMQVEQVFGSSGDDVINASLVTAGLHLYGQGGHDTITGGSGNDIILGGDGNDVMGGGGGNDLFRPGIGNDTVNGTSDSVSFIDVQAGLTISLVSGTATGTGVNTTMTGILNVDGTNFNDVITGDANANALNGKGGDDWITGLGANDILFGGAGIDTLDYSASPTGVTARIGAGAGPGIGGHAAGDNPAEFENLIGSMFSDVLEGSTGVNIINGLDGNDVIHGLQGNDTIDGGDGNDAIYGGVVGGTDQDTMIGGNGNDTFYADASDIDGGGLLLVTPGAGTDTVNARALTIALVSWILPNGLENANGTNQNDILNGSGVSNAIVISGFGGADSITGGSGADFLYGGDGADTILGGSGIDRLFGGNDNDFLDGGNDGSQDFLTGNAGTDTGELNGAPLDFAFADVEVLI